MSDEIGKERVCRCCGKTFDYPAPASLATKRLCADCSQIGEPIRRILEVHQLEITRLKRQLAKLGGGPAKPRRDVPEGEGAG